jgi:phosphoadenosine phosphosulfate reductase
MATYKEKNKEFADYPKYKENYIRAFQRMLDVRDADNKKECAWKTGQDVFDWWIERYKYEVKGQINLDEFIDIKGAD